MCFHLAIIFTYIFPYVGIDLCIDLCFALDMVLSSQTAYVKESGDGLVYSRKSIAAKYASGWLPIDLASTVPIDKLVRVPVP